jgi:hypothetical protein
MKCLKHTLDVTGCSRLNGSELVKGICDTCLSKKISLVKDFAKILSKKGDKK